MSSAPEIRFVLPNRTDAEITRLRETDPDRDWRELNMAANACTVQNYAILNNHGFDVRLENQFSPDAINIGFVTCVAASSMSDACFLVGMRAEYPPSWKCHYHVAINDRQTNRNTYWIPPWPQPGLVPRDADRGETIETVGYFGREVNTQPRFTRFTPFLRRSAGFLRVKQDVEAIVAKLGLKLVIPGLNGWNDYSKVDVAVAYRDWGDSPFPTKPPQKMASAWRAGIPFIAGGDSAYAQVARPGRDYLCATSPGEFEIALRRLTKDKQLYSTMVKRGRQNAVAYNDWVVQRWRRLLTEILPARFSLWSERRRLVGRRLYADSTPPSPMCVSATGVEATAPASLQTTGGEQ